MNRTTKILLIAGVAAIVGSAAIAGVVKARESRDDMRGFRHGMMQDRGGERGLAMMEQFDLNKDGKVSQEEIDQARKDKFAKFDTNKDGKLSLKEFEALWLETTRPQMVRSFQHLDPNGDAAVTLEEYTKPYERMVQRHDRNGDGQWGQDDARRRGPRHDAPKGAPAAPQGQAQ